MSQFDVVQIVDVRTYRSNRASIGDRISNYTSHARLALQYILDSKVRKEEKRDRRKWHYSLSALSRLLVGWGPCELGGQ